MKANESQSEVEHSEKDRVISVESKKTVIPYKYHESILLILWGWIMFIDYFRFYLSKEIMISFDVRHVLTYLSTVMVVAGIIYTAYYLNKRRQKLKTVLGKSLIGVWASVYLCMVMVNLMQHNVMHQVIFEFQHSIFMLITAVAIILTGRLIRNKQVFYGGIVFVALAFVSSYLKLKDQLLLEAIGWFIAFVIPGHLIYSKQKKNSIE